MIEAKEVNFAYRRGVPVLQDIQCKVEDGEAVALLGHNGSGKTTLSRLFMALNHPRSGQVLVDGVDIVDCEPADLADKVGYVFQNPDLQLLGDTVYDEVAYGLQTRKMPKADLDKQVREAVEAMGLTSCLDQYPRGLSFGQKRRLGVAVALALQPRTLILDEITNGQDEQEKLHMMNYLSRLQREKHITLILITHDMEIARKYTTHALVLHDGQLVYDGKTKELFDGRRPIEEWGLKQPVLARLGALFGVDADSPEVLCDRLELKEAPKEGQKEEKEGGEA
ncbi:energy-coupling factor ABC transporter ATP-binding protein [Acidaminococcus timonensis]|jgi:energy-coupling factor transporter ATP-binding protein EcfA2|uniref:energy-coupling factor ABC transporter ATP-binding protein n=1 Tax=Acidaminococcus timonensis TaxID=1871002 RepID=UPI003A5BCAAF